MGYISSFIINPYPRSQLENMPGFTCWGSFLQSDIILRVTVFKFLQWRGWGIYSSEMMLHHGYLVSDNSGNSSDFKTSGTKPRETASYPNRTDTLFTKLQKHGGSKCHEPNAPWHGIMFQKSRYLPQKWACSRHLYKTAFEL